jgi:sugar phosphate isomerase/epimerase
MKSIFSSIGVMQGRLLPKFKGRYQAHPVDYWQDEFYYAADLGLDYIEFILDHNDLKSNPLMSQIGITLIQDEIQKTGVGVRSICADYFMIAPLHHESYAVQEQSKIILRGLLNNCKILGVTDIVIPCVDQSSLRDNYDLLRLKQSLLPLIDLAEASGINLALETDLAPEPFAELLNSFPSERITVNYDTGNSASLGYNPIQEFSCYGQRISDIHIKDRVVGGGSVFLGTGDTDFDAFFKALDSINFTGPVIFQAYRDDEGLEIFKKQLQWFNNLVKKNNI